MSLRLGGVFLLVFAACGTRFEVGLLVSDDGVDVTDKLGVALFVVYHVQGVDAACQVVIGLFGSLAASCTPSLLVLGAIAYLAFLCEFVFLQGSSQCFYPW